MMIGTVQVNDGKIFESIYMVESRRAGVTGYSGLRKRKDPRFRCQRFLGSRYCQQTPRSAGVPVVGLDTGKPTTSGIETPTTGSV